MHKGHGGEIYDLSYEIGLPIHEIRDFSSNVSCYPLPECIVKKTREYIEHIRYLPQIENSRLVRGFAEYYGLMSDRVLVGAGTTEFIYLLPKALKPSRIIIITPTYADYISSAKWNEIPVVEFGPFIDKASYVSFVKEGLKENLHENDLVFLCNPNNPTGHLIDKEDLISLISLTPKVYWVIDESYINFLDEIQNTLIHQRERNLVVLRSFSKILGVPGIRLGFMISDPAISHETSKIQLPWNLSTITQKIGEYIISLQTILNDYISNVREFYRTEKSYFLSRVIELDDVCYIQGDAHFMLFSLKNGQDFTPIYKRLKKEGLLVRHCGNFKGLSNSYFRICPRFKEDNDLLIEKIKFIMNTSNCRK